MEIELYLNPKPHNFKDILMKAKQSKPAKVKKLQDIAQNELKTAIHAMKSSNHHKINVLLFSSWLIHNTHNALKHLEREEQLTRVEMLILSKVHIWNEQEIEPSRELIYKGQRTDYYALIKYLDRLVLKGYLMTVVKKQPRFGLGLVTYYRITNAGLNVIRSFSDLLTGD